MLEKILGLSLDQCVWPQYNPALVEENEVHYAIQVNGKLRATLTSQKGVQKDSIVGQAQLLIAKWLEQKTIVKVIFIQDRTVNFVVKE